MIENISFCYSFQYCPGCTDMKEALGWQDNNGWKRVCSDKPEPICHILMRPAYSFWFSLNDRNIRNILLLIFDNDIIATIFMFRIWRVILYLWFQKTKIWLDFHCWHLQFQLDFWHRSRLLLLIIETNFHSPRIRLNKLFWRRYWKRSLTSLRHFWLLMIAREYKSRALYLSDHLTKMP